MTKDKDAHPTEDAPTPAKPTIEPTPKKRPSFDVSTGKLAPRASKTISGTSVSIGSEVKVSTGKKPLPSVGININSNATGNKPKVGLGAIPIGVQPGKQNPQSIHKTNKFALWNLGFRPFYFFGALFGIISIAIWWLGLKGYVRIPLVGFWWHGHEMIFGFVGPIIIGFLYTAGRNWTSQQTPKGMLLMGLVLLWLAGRIVMAPSIYPFLRAHVPVFLVVVDCLFLPLAGYLLLRIFIRVKSKRNYLAACIPILIGCCNLVFHASTQGWVWYDPIHSLLAAIALVVVLETIILGRIVAMFTRNALSGQKIQQPQWLEWTCQGSTTLALLAWALSVPGPWWLVSLIALVALIIRGLYWKPWLTTHNALLCSLHIAAWWIPIAFIFVIAHQLDLATRTLAVHALAIGAIGTLIVAMITRTALAHTGYMLRAGWGENISSIFMNLAAVIRLVCLLAAPIAYNLGIGLTALCWILSLAVYLWCYTPRLMRPRIDGKPG